MQIDFSGNQVSFYLDVRKDVSVLASNISPFILKPTKKPSPIEANKANFHLLEFPKGKDILEIKKT